MLWAVEQIVIFESKLNTRSGHFRGIRELQHNDEPNADEDERQVGQHHQTADRRGCGPTWSPRLPRMKVKRDKSSQMRFWKFLPVLNCFNDPA